MERQAEQRKVQGRSSTEMEKQNQQCAKQGRSKREKEQQTERRQEGSFSMERHRDGIQPNKQNRQPDSTTKS